MGAELNGSWGMFRASNAILLQGKRKSDRNVFFVLVDAAVPHYDAQQEGIKSEKENVDSGGGSLAAVQRSKNKQ